MLARRELGATSIKRCQVVVRSGYCSFFSRWTAEAEKEWDTRELELLAAIATMEQFQYYLEGQRFTLETDHNNLRWIMNIKNSQSGG